MGLFKIRAKWVETATEKELKNKKNIDCSILCAISDKFSWRPYKIFGKI